MTIILGVPLSKEMQDILARVSMATKMPPGDVVGHLLGAHVAELSEYITYMEHVRERPSKAQELAPWALHNYGPLGLIETIKGFDPTYRTEAECIAEWCNDEWS